MLDPENSPCWSRDLERLILYSTQLRTNLRDILDKVMNSPLGEIKQVQVSQDDVVLKSVPTKYFFFPSYVMST